MIKDKTLKCWLELCDEAEDYIESGGVVPFVLIERMCAALRMAVSTLNIPLERRERNLAFMERNGIKNVPHDEIDMATGKPLPPEEREAQRVTSAVLDMLNELTLPPYLADIQRAFTVGVGVGVSADEKLRVKLRETLEGTK